jgi:hypothetical protein
VRHEEKGAAMYPLEPQEQPFEDFGVNVRVLWPGGRARSTTQRALQEGDRPADTPHHVIVGAGEESGD